MTLEGKTEAEKPTDSMRQLKADIAEAIWCYQKTANVRVHGMDVRFLDISLPGETGETSRKPMVTNITLAVRT